MTAFCDDRRGEIMFRFLLVALIICGLLLGCATTAKYEKILDSWIGSTEDRLVRSWGPPDSVYDSPSQRYLTYMDSRQGYVPGTAPTYQSYAIGNTVYTKPVGGSQGYSYSMHCKTTFEIADGRITSWRYEGNSCRSN